jgi:hypothetical protein
MPLFDAADIPDGSATIFADFLASLDLGVGKPIILLDDSDCDDANNVLSSE